MAYVPMLQPRAPLADYSKSDYALMGIALVLFLGLPSFGIAFLAGRLTR